MVASIFSRRVSGGSPVPNFTVLPSISPSSGNVGDTFTGTDGTVSNGSVVSRRWLLDGTSIGTGTTVVPATAGTLVFENTASGPGGSAVGTSPSVVVSNIVYSLPALELALAVPGNTYPPQLTSSRPVEYITSDTFRLQWSLSETFASGITEATFAIDAAIDTTTVPGLSSITSPAQYFFRIRGERGASISPWSNTVKHGVVTSATITSSASPSVAENTVNPTGTLTANETVTWSIVGGADAALFTVNASTGVWTLNATPDYETKSSYVVTFRATDLATLTTDQTMTLTIIDQDEIPNAFTFTDITGGTLSTAYTSNTVTIAGLGVGVTVPVTVTGGTYSKNSGAYTSAAGTAANGDTFSLQLTSSPSYFTAANATLTVGAGSDTYTVTTQSDPAAVALWNGAYPTPLDLTATNPQTATFTNQYFQAGTAVIAVAAPNRLTAGVTVGGSAATLIGSAATDDAHTSLTVWQVNIPTSGNYNVVCTSTTYGFRHLAICFDVLTNVNPTNTGTAILLPGFRSDPQVVSSLTCSSTGIILAYALGYNQTVSASWNVGTEVRDFNDGAAGSLAMSSAFNVGTAAMSVNYNNFGAMVAISWEH